MAIPGQLLSLSSNAFRAAAYVFLRIIPSPIFKILLPALYLTYAVSFLLVTRARALSGCEISRSASHEKEDVANGDKTYARSSLVRGILISARSIVFSSPNTSLRLHVVSFCINSVVLLFAIDFLTHPIRYPATDVAFARIGAVDYQSVKITVRYPHDQANETFIQLQYRVSNVLPGVDRPWLDGPVFRLLEEDDWVATRRLDALLPSTGYQYKLFPLNSTEALAPPFLDHPSTFKTFPDPRFLHADNFRFIATSCMLPNYPYVPGAGYSIKGFELLHRSLQPQLGVSDTAEDSDANKTIFGEIKAYIGDVVLPFLSDLRGIPRSRLAADIPAEFLLFLGDFIYADVPVYFGNTLEAYRRFYRRVYASPDFRKIYHSLPIMHIYDDHEIINNFAGGSDTSHYFGLNGTEAFQTYNGNANYDPIERGENYYKFSYGSNAFFVTDTRLHRSPINSSGTGPKTMLGDIQLAALHNWLVESNHTAIFKFIVSSVPFTSLWQHDAQIDSWAAFPEEKEQLLQMLHTVPNVFIISGDRHEFAVIEFNGPDGRSNTVREISTSPLNMFNIPLIRTMNAESSVRVERFRLSRSGLAETNESALETYTVPKERVVKYLPSGNHKWTEFYVNTRDEVPRLHIEVMINGRLAHREQFEGVQVKLTKSTGLSLFKPHNFHDILGKLGLTSQNWF